MRIVVTAAVLASLLAPAVAHAGAGNPDRTFGRRGTVTLKATSADAVGSIQQDSTELIKRLGSSDPASQHSAKSAAAV